MIVLVEDSFRKDTKKIKDAKLLERLKKVIIDAQNASTILDIQNVKKLEGYKSFYRIRVGEFRAGFKLEDGTTIRFMRFLDRKDIYKYFP